MEILNQIAVLRPKSEACDGNTPFRWGTRITEELNETSGELLVGNVCSFFKVNPEK